MNEEEQIEEMAMLITEGARQAIEDVDAIYKAGYRKASEVAREIFEEIEKHLVTGCTFYGQAIHSIGVGTFAELKKKYTEEGK